MIIRFIRVEQLEDYLQQGWEVLEQGNEMVTVCYRR